MEGCTHSGGWPGLDIIRWRDNLSSIICSLDRNRKVGHLACTITLLSGCVWQNVGKIERRRGEEGGGEDGNKRVASRVAMGFAWKILHVCCKL